MIVGFGRTDVEWYAAAAVIGVFAVAAAVRVKQFAAWVMRPIARSLKASYVQWHAEVVEQHVEPKFTQLREEMAASAVRVADRADATAAALRDETRAMATDVREAAEAQATRLTEQLERHTNEEAALVRGVVREEVAPLVEQRDALIAEIRDTREMTITHMSADEEIVHMAATAVRHGHDELIERMDRQHAEVLEMIDRGK